MKHLKTASFTFVLALALVATSSCGHKRIALDNDTATASSEKSPGEGVVGKINWFKKKGKLIDMEVVLTNKYATLINFDKSGFRMKLGELEGNLRFEKFNGHLQPGQSETKIVSFEFPTLKKVEGTATLMINRFTAEDKDKPKDGTITITFDTNKE